MEREYKVDFSISAKYGSLREQNTTASPFWHESRKIWPNVSFAHLTKAESRGELNKLI